VRAPDYAGPLIGWRVWLVVERDGGLRLASVVHDELWPAKGALVARCRRDENRFLEPSELAAHAAPHEDCSCGIHAARDPDDVRSYLRGRDEPRTVCRVLGTVLLWGSVVECEHGWRASYAYPHHLLLDDPEVERLLAAVA
jgi:hypothetical protein